MLGHAVERAKQMGLMGSMKEAVDMTMEFTSAGSKARGKTPMSRAMLAAAMGRGGNTGR